jgi:hypothetical protein
MNTASLMWGVLFGSIGLGFFIYGKKQQRVVPLVSGIALMAYTYFFTNPYAVFGIGVVLMSLPYFIRA